MSAHANAAVDAQPKLVSIEEWCDLDDDDRRELVDGVLVEAEVPNYTHESIVTWLVLMLATWGRPRGARVFGSGGKVAVAARTGRMPDVTVFLREDGKPPTKGPATKPPSIVVEVVSSTPRDARRDRVEKLAEYAAFGARFYWLVDPGLRTFEILELDAQGRYAHVIGVGQGRIEPVPGCEGLSLDVDDLWLEIDSLGDAEAELDDEAP